METQAPSVTADMADTLDALWREAAETFAARVETIEDHVAGLLLGTDDDQLADEACHAAHKLAGTLGMFGLAGGSALASELEGMLEANARPDDAEVARMAEIACELRDQIDRRSAAPEDRAPPTRSSADATVRTLGSDRSVLESVRWIAGQRGFTTEHGEGTGAGPPADVVVVDAADIDAIEVIRVWSRSGAAVVALAPAEAFVERAALLGAGAAAVVTDSTPAPVVVDVVEDLLDLGRAAPRVVMVGADPDEGSAIEEAFAAEGCHLVVLESPEHLGPMLMVGGTDVIVVGPASTTIDVVAAIDVITADPSWGSCLVIALVAEREDMIDVGPDVLAAGAADVIAVDGGWGPVARRVRARARQSAAMRRTRFGVTSEREQLATRLAHMREAGRTSGSPMSILYFQLTGLQAVNAGEGHDAGDQLLRRADRFLRTVFRAGDLVGPWSGATFVAGMATDRAVATARLRSALDDLAHAGIACVGAVAAAPDDGDAVDELLQVAARRAGIDRDDDGATRAEALTVVVVEDDEVVAALVTELLEADGYRVRHVADGPSAVPILTDPDVADDVALVLLDITLPGLDGFGILRAMQRANTLPHVPVVMLTARTLEEEVDSAMALGAVDHVAKPFSPRVLLRRVERAIALRAL